MKLTWNQTRRLRNILAASCLALACGASAAIAEASPAQAQTFGQATMTADERIYAAMPNGELRCWEYTDGATGANTSTSWRYGGVVGSGWNSVPHVFTSAGSIYAIRPNGELLRRTHNGAGQCLGVNIAGAWSELSSLGTIPNVRRAFGMSSETANAANGVFYVIDNLGNLQWYQDLGTSIAGPKAVGRGWQNVREIVGANDGVIYFIDTAGDLYWARHVAWQYGGGLESDSNWIQPHRIGSGWGAVKKLAATSEYNPQTGASVGFIYATMPSGELRWFQHNGYPTGVPASAGGFGSYPTGRPVGTHWDTATQIFIGSHTAPRLH